MVRVRVRVRWSKTACWVWRDPRPSSPLSVQGPKDLCCVSPQKKSKNLAKIEIHFNAGRLTQCGSVASR